MRDPALWQRLQAHPFDDPAAERPYSERLRRGLRLSEGAAEDLIAEYRRWIYLCTVSEARLSPPPLVDAAWHLHLTYTRDYWERLPRALGTRPPHHDPATGPEDEARHGAQYAAARKLYEAEFGAPPPGLWPGGQVQASPVPPLVASACAGALGTLFALAGAKGVAAVLLGLGFCLLVHAAIRQRRRHVGGGGTDVSLSLIVGGGDGDSGGDGGGCGD